MVAMASPTPDDLPAGWTVVLPVKGGPEAKSRLDHPGRAALARAVALDAVAAVVSCPRVARVLVVTADPVVAAEHGALGADVVVEPREGLAAALEAGLAAARQRDPLAPCALLLADLPSLRPDELAAALDACAGLLSDGAAQVVVPDADGTGTVLLAAARPEALRPRFGARSALAHARTSTVLTAVGAGVRRDVDTVAHLHEAVGHGVGPRTAEVLAGQPRSTMAPSDASLSPNRS